MQSGFTKKAEEVLQYAAQSAFELGHGSVGSEHILIGILKCDGCLAQTVLNNNGVDEDKVVDVISQLITPDRNIGVKEPDSYTPRAARIIDNARKEARRFKAQLIGTEHILIGMLKEPDSVATRLLCTLGISVQRVYVDLMVAMGEDGNSYKEEFAAGGKSRKNPRRRRLTSTAGT